MEREEGRCFRKHLGKVCWGATVLEISDTGSTGACSHCAGTLGPARCSSSWEEERDSRFHLLLGLGSTKQGQNFISL